MQSDSRACVAYIAANISKPGSSSVYDNLHSKQINISGNIDADCINIYDHERGCHIAGTLSSLFDYGNNAHIQLKINGNQFSGYDHHTKNLFSGNINGSSISIYDHETSSRYQYDI